MPLQTIKSLKLTSFKLPDRVVSSMLELNLKNSSKPFFFQFQKKKLQTEKNVFERFATGRPRVPCQLRQKKKLFGFCFVVVFHVT